MENHPMISYSPAVKLIALLLLSAPAFAGTSQPVGASDTEVLKSNVLVWNDSEFYTDASDDATTVHAASLKGERKDAAGEVVAMKIISVTKTGFVEVEPAAELDCTWSRLQTSDDLTQLHLFVKRADLAPVLVDSFSKTYNDGSKVAFKPGMPLVPTSDGKYVVGVRGHGDIAIELPPQSIGHSYTPEKAPKAATTIGDREYELVPKTAVNLADTSIVLEGQRAIGIEPRGAQTVFSIKTRCAALDVIAPSKAVRAIEEDEDNLIEVSSGLAVMDLRDSDYIPQGSVLSTPSGRAIAVAAKPIYMMSKSHGKAACIDRRIKIGVYDGEALEPKDGDDKIRVCVPATRVLHEQVRSSSSANGTTGR
jgi:hypothetical protein